MGQAEHPLFILRSGSTGNPRHTAFDGRLPAVDDLTMKWVFDYKPNDVFWCTADVGWVTGHSYVCYGPLAVGATEIIFEGVPVYPDAGRFWKMIQDHKVTVFYTAPTAIRSLIKAGGDLPKQYDLSSLRILGTVGEPINPEAWMWYHNTVGGERCPIVDTWWQTESRRPHDPRCPGDADHARLGDLSPARHLYRQSWDEPASHRQRQGRHTGDQERAVHAAHDLG